jgi:phosphoribosyl 1,2-cyclic phosphodiesterase
MRLASLGSGSQGNATLVQSAQRCVLIDCGFSLAQFEKRLQRLELHPDKIDAVLVTHEHSDHATGVQRLATRYELPLWMTVGTSRALAIEDYQPIHGGGRYSLGDLEIEAVTVPHDAAEPVQFVIHEVTTQRRLGILTDSGHVSEHMRQVYDGVEALLLEFNYDPDMLHNGPYPYSLKQRVAGKLGHLSNLQSIELLQRIDTQRLECLVAAHISQKNNSPQRVEDLLQQIDHRGQKIIACQQQGFEWIEI